MANEAQNNSEQTDLEILEAPTEEKTTPETTEEKTTEEETTDESKGATDDFDLTEHTDDEETEEDTETTTEEDTAPVLPSLKDIKEKYPKILEEFPEIREVMVREQQYAQIFDSPEVAEDAAGKANAFNILEGELTQGNVGALINALDETDKTATKKVITNFLPTVLEKDKALYADITKPAIAYFIQALYNHGDRAKEESFKAAALWASRFLTGKDELPDPEKLQPSVATEDKTDKAEAEKFQKERQTFIQTQYANAQTSVQNRVIKVLTREIEKNLDPENALTPYMKKQITKDVIAGINEALVKNRMHMQQVNSIWAKAASAGFNADAQTKIVNTVLARSKNLIGPVRQRVLKEALGKETKKTSSARKEIPAGQPAKSNGAGKVPNAKQVDWKKTSDLDFLNDKVALKGS